VALLVRPVDTDLHVHTYVLEGGSTAAGTGGGAADSDAGPDGDALDGAEINA